MNNHVAIDPHSDDFESDLASARIYQGTEMILVAEDDQLVRSFIRAVLEEFGYTVVEAFDGRDAVARFRESRDRIALVLCDLIMPGISGIEVKKQITKQFQEAQFLFVTGHPGYTVHKRTLLKEGFQIISKPFSPGMLLKAVRETLNRTAQEKNKPGHCQRSRP